MAALAHAPADPPALTPDDFAFSRLASFHVQTWGEDEIPAAHHRLICRHLEALETHRMFGVPFVDPDGGRFNRLMVLAPPGSAKTRYVSHDFPAWWLGRNPKHRVVACSHTTDYAEDNGEIVRDIVGTPDFERIFSVGLKAGAKAKSKWGVIGMAGRPYGQYIAAGVDKAITGRRFDLGIIDDPIKDAKTADSPDQREAIWKWYKTSFRSRRKPKAAIVIINTRWHDDDLSGRILPEDWEPRTGWVKARDGEWWYVINLPAIAEMDDVLGRELGDGLWPEYIPQAHWEQDRRTLSPREWSAMYQQRPTPEGGQFFRKEWRLDYGNSGFGAARKLPIKSRLKFYLSSDFATKEGSGDFTVHGVWAVDDEDNAYLVDCWYGQMTPDKWAEIAIDLMLEYDVLYWFAPRDMIQKSVGPFIRQRMKDRKCHVAIQEISEQGAKDIKARGFQGKLSLGAVFYPCARTYPQTEIWTAWLWRQMLRFLTTPLDDGVDMQSIFFRGLDVIFGGEPPPPPEQPLVVNTASPTFDQAKEAHFKAMRRNRDEED